MLVADERATSEERKCLSASSRRGCSYQHE